MLNIIYISFYIYSLIIYLQIENFFTNLISNMDKIKLTSKSIILKIFLHLFQKLAFKYVKLFIVSFFFNMDTHYRKCYKCMCAWARTLGFPDLLPMRSWCWRKPRSSPWADRRKRSHRGTGSGLPGKRRMSKKRNSSISTSEHSNTVYVDKLLSSNIENNTLYVIRFFQ